MTPKSQNSISPLTVAGLLGPWLLGAVGVVFLVVCVVKAWVFTVDDSYITLRYSRNVAEGLGPTFNGTGPRAEGYTTLLWMLILVVPHLVGLDAVVFAKGLGVVATLTTLVIVARWARTETRERDLTKGVERELANGAAGDRRASVWAAGAAAACFATIPATAVHAVSGMETALFTLLATALFMTAADYVRKPGSHFLVACALLIGLTRPEGNLIAAVTLATVVMLLPKRDRRSLVLYALAGWVLPVAAYELWRHHYYGLVFPLPFYVKLATPGLLPGLPDVGEWLIGPPLRFAILAAPALVRPPRTLWPAMTATLTAVAFFVLPQHQMGYDHRYLAPFDATLSVLAAVGLARLVARRRRSWAVAAAVGVAVALGVDGIEAPGVVAGEAEYGRGLAAAHERLGRELLALARPHSRLAISDAGAVPYFSRWWTLDLIGLNDAHIARSPRPPPNWVLAQQPDVIVLASPRTDRFDTWDWNPWEAELFDACVAAGFERVAVRRFAADYWLWVMARPDSAIALAFADRPARSAF